jgi:hypothetical protein
MANGRRRAERLKNVPLDRPREQEYRLNADQRRVRQLDVYYAVLNEQRAFRAALRALADELHDAISTAAAARPLLTGPRMWDEPWPDDRAERLIATVARGITPSIRARLEGFADQWRLPKADAVVDLWWSLRSPGADEQATLRTSFRVGEMRADHLPERAGG